MSSGYSVNAKGETLEVKKYEIQIKRELDSDENQEIPMLSNVEDTTNLINVKEEPELIICDELPASWENTKRKRNKKPVAVSNNNPHEAIRAKQFHCYSCGTFFKTKILIENHLQQFHSEQPPKSRKHSNKKDKKCEVCSNTFYSNRDMRQHLIAVHMKEKRYECELCGLKHSSFNNLNRHLKRHETKLCCGLCFKFMFTKSALEKHMQSHFTKKTVKTFECEICHIQIKRYESIRRHIQAVHQKIKYYCNYCDKYYCYKKSLVYHISQMHSNK